MASYGALIQTPNVSRLLGAMVLARLPIGINGIAIVLFLRSEHESFGVAGAAAGGLALGAGIGAPLAARLIDRLGVRVLVVFAGGHALGLGLFVASGMAEAPPALLVAEAVLAGMSLPPISSVLRAAYGRLLGEDPFLLRSAFALDSVLTEMIFVGGPLLTAVVVWLVSPAAALGASALAVLSGTLWFLSSLPAGSVVEAERGGRDMLGALRSPGMRTIVMAMVPVGFAFGATEVILPAFADDQGHRELAGVLIAIWSLGSAAGGLVYGARSGHIPIQRAHLYAALLVPPGLLCLALASSPLTMALLVIPAGLPIAPLLATRTELSGLVAPAGAETEAFTWPLTAMVSGVAMGAAAAGALADGPGWRVAVFVAAAAAALGAATSVMRRRTLVASEPVTA